jgi:hypothetical protein
VASAKTAKAPVNLMICGGFAIYGDGSVDGFSIDPFRRYLLPIFYRANLKI